MAAPRYRALVKATRNESGTPRRSANWIVARRGWLRVFDDRLECGDWVIPASAVVEAVLYDARMGLLRAPVLAVTTDDGTWQFGFNPWVRIGDHLPFAFRREQVRLRYSVFSAVVRLAAIAYLTYVLIRRG